MMMATESVRAISAAARTAIRTMSVIRTRWDQFRATLPMSDPRGETLTELIDTLDGEILDEVLMLPP